MEHSRVKEIFKSVCASEGVEVKTNIVIDGKLTSTLGYVRYNTQSLKPNLVKFSKRMVDRCGDAYVTDIIKHEAAHFILLSRGIDHKHEDMAYKELCWKIGCVNDNPRASYNLDTNLRVLHKYLVYCKKCGELVGTFEKKTGRFKLVEQGLGKCGICGGDLEIR